MADNQSNLIMLCGLWKSTSSNGVDYLKGKTNREIIVLSGHSLMIFPNNRRKTDAHPEFYLYSAPPFAPRGEGSYQGKADPEQGKADGSAGTPSHRGRGGKSSAPVDFEGEEKIKDEDKDDIIPF